MAKLLSHHDRYHAHAILGLLALLHFAYRFGCALTGQRESFTPDLLSAATLLIHVFLHVLSFQFELPRNRIWTKPMIWREFRVHNAIFAYRHLVGTALGTWAAEWWWKSPGMTSLVAKVALVLVSCKAADVATDMIGSQDDRTTNAMPYPKNTPKAVEKVAKFFYAKSQFAATALAAFGTPSLSFCSVFAIEIASFLMTLVRKGIIEARTYHIVYAFSLFIMFPVLVATLHSGDREAELAAFRGMSACFISIPLRFELRLSKYITWSAAIVGGFVFVEVLPSFVDLKWIAWPGMLWSAGDTLYSFHVANNGPPAETCASEDANVGKEPASSGERSTQTKGRAAGA